TEKEPIQQVSQKSSTVEAQAEQEPVQRVTQNFTALKAQAVIQVQQVPMDSSMVGTEVVEEQMQKEPRGFMRLYGRGVTKTTLKQKENVESSVTATNEMQKKLNEMEDRMVEKLELPKRSTRHEITVGMLLCLNRMYPGL
ncbi:hypothetical protein H5410_051919, partial [Solanum commersonii]